MTVLYVLVYLEISESFRRQGDKIFFQRTAFPKLTKQVQDWKAIHNQGGRQKEQVMQVISEAR